MVDVEMKIINIQNGKTIPLPTDGTPGFEVIILIAAIALFLVQRRKKKYEL